MKIVVLDAATLGTDLDLSPLEAMGRLTFRSHVLDMNGDSYRLKATMQNKS